MIILQNPSPNFNLRRYSYPDMIILHYTGMKTAEAALARMCENIAPRVSAHYFIDRKGQVYQLVDESKRSWHAGVSFWRGEKDINSRSVGIELENKGHEWGYENFTEIQIDHLIILLKDIKKRYDIPPTHILAHSDVAPMRKKDVGELFPWQRLMSEGLIPNLKEDKVCARAKSHPLTSSEYAKEIIPMLRDIGYETDPIYCFTAKNRAALEAFQRRFTGFDKRQAVTRLMLRKVYKYYAVVTE